MGSPELVIVVAGIGVLVLAIFIACRLPRPPPLNLNRPSRLPSAVAEEAQEDAAVPEDREAPVVPATVADSLRECQSQALVPRGSLALGAAAESSLWTSCREACTSYADCQDNPARRV